LQHGVAALAAERADLLTACPRQEVVTWAEKLVVPFFPWSILSFLPLALAYRVRASALCAANGQHMLFRRAAYDQIGGYAAVRTDAVYDIALARLIKAQGLSWRTAACTGTHQVFEGSQQLFAGSAIGCRRSGWLWIGIALAATIVLVLMQPPASTYSVVMAVAESSLPPLWVYRTHAWFSVPFALLSRHHRSGALHRREVNGLWQLPSWKRRLRCGQIRWCGKT
jgi:hypothetical protein